MNNNKLIIMRHAKSDWTSSARTDFDRPLAARGKKDAPRMGDWLKQQGLIADVITSSPALRARETACMVAEKIGFPEQDICWCEDIYGAALGDLLVVIEHYIRGPGCMLLVGHNPGLDSLVEYLSADTVAYSHTGKLMTTAAVAVLDFGDGPVTAGVDAGRLVKLIRPKELKQT